MSFFWFSLWHLFILSCFYQVVLSVTKKRNFSCIRRAIWPYHFFFPFFFYQNIVDLQCCASFRCMALWFSFMYVCVCIHTYIYIYIYTHTQSCSTLCSPLDCSLPGSSVHRISQVRILEWIAISFSKVSSWPRNQTHISCIFLTAGGFFTLWAIKVAYTYIWIPFQILFPYRLLQNIEYSSWCYTSRFFLFTYFIYRSVYMLTPNS